MKNSNANIPFLVTKVNYSVAGIFLLVITLFGFCTYQYGFSWLVLILSIPVLMIAGYLKYTAQQYFEVLDKMQDVLLRTNQGDLHHRINQTRGMGEVGKVAWELTETLDIMESFFKEIGICFSQVAKGNYDRYILSDGFPGLQKQSAKNINKALQQMNENKELIINNRFSAGLHSLNTSNLLDNLKNQPE